MNKYFTIVIRADDEKAARQLVPGEKIGPNTIVACSLGHQISVNEKLQALIPDDRDEEASAIEHDDLRPFLE